MKQTTLYAIIIIIVFTLALTFTYKDGALFIKTITRPCEAINFSHC
jgi:hypothetical protein